MKLKYGVEIPPVEKIAHRRKMETNGLFQNFMNLVSGAVKSLETA